MSVIITNELYIAIEMLLTNHIDSLSLNKIYRK